MVGRNHLPRSGLSVEQRDLARGWVHHAVLGQPVGPRFGHDMQELQRLGPVRGEFRICGVGQTPGQIDTGPLRFIHERGQIPSQYPGAIGRPRGAAVALHRQDQRGQRGQALHRLHRRRQTERSGQSRGRFIQRTQSSDPRQQQRLAVRHAQECLCQRPRGTTGWEEDQPMADGKWIVEFGLGAVFG